VEQLGPGQALRAFRDNDLVLADVGSLTANSLLATPFVGFGGKFRIYAPSLLPSALPPAASPGRLETRSAKLAYPVDTHNHYI
jgi:hypothetical protein